MTVSVWLVSDLADVWLRAPSALAFVYLRSESRSQRAPSCLSHVPLIVSPFSLNVGLEPLPEIQRCEVHGNSQERPDASSEGHRMRPDNPLRIEVVLRIPVAVGVDGNDWDAVRIAWDF
jgi:hypothetical protein